MRKLILSSMLIIVIISILGSCNVNPFWGGGIEVDIEAPLLTVDYPSAFDFVANGFTIRGTCTDNKEIARIVIKETRTGSEWLADINGNNWSKIITMDTDGEYVFDVYAYDATGNSSENSYKRITLTIDTTPPVAEVIYPPLLDVNVLKSYDFRNFDYIDYFKNQTFQIKGKTDSEYKVKSVTLELLDPSDDSVVYTNTISYDETLDQIVNINFGEPASAKQGSVWNWAFNIDCSSDILVAGNPLEKNKAYYFNARVKSKSMSDVEKVEKKKAVCVFNESDTPWQTITSIIDNDSVTPEAIISGNAYDDDGIKKIYIKIIEENISVDIEDYLTWINESTDDSKTIIIDKSAETPKPRMFTWSANAPKAVGNYKIYVLTEDVNGKISGSFTVKSFIVPQVFVSVTSPNNGDYKRTQENFVITGLWSNNIGEMKAISVKWIEGNVAQDASFDSTGWNVNSSLFGLTDGLQNFEITAFDKFGNKGITRLYIYADSIIPSVTNVSSSVDSG
ncbi:MAG: Ig-like domain repeat protein, partial [Spirochaetes bacterium]|nr:Ig-like domain repeat protein [Spirochaetota bacterium]